MSAAEQLFNVGMVIILITVTMVFKDQDHTVTTAMQEEAKVALQLEEIKT